VLRLTFVGLVSLAVALDASARIQVHLAGDPLKDVREVTIHAECGAGCAAAVTQRVAPFAPVALDLDPKFAWTVTASAPGLWAWPRLVDRDAAAVEIPLFHAATVKVALRAAGAKPPEAIEARVEMSRKPPERGSSLPPARVECTTADSSWSCTVPAATIDLRLSAEGFAPHYAFGIQPPPGRPLDLGAVTLVRGASIHGWIEADDPARVEVALNIVPRPKSGAPPLTARPNARGFFQFAGLHHGTYAVVATRGGWSEARSAPVRVAEAREYAVPSTLRLEPLARLDVAVTPPLTRSGTAWVVELERIGSDPSLLTPVAEGSAAPSGLWTREGVAAGRYVVAIRDPKGALRVTRTIDVAGPTLAAIDVGDVRARGRVTAGGEPVAATVELSSNKARVTFRSDGEGAFSGTLPHEGRWSVAVQPDGSSAKIRALPIEIKRPDAGEAEIEIELPGGRLQGTVVAADGTPVAGAGVLVHRGALRNVDGSAITGEDGTFAFVGLHEGQVSVAARSRAGSSDVVPHEIRESGTDPLKLVLRPQRLVDGRVVDRGGAPLAGAIVRYFGAGILGKQETVTGPTGAFSLDVPGSTRRVDLAVLVPGQPIRLVPAVIDDDPRPIEVVVGGPGGNLRVQLGAAPPWPFIGRDGMLLSLRFLLFPQGLGPAFGDPEALTFALEAGPYMVCPDPVLTDRCKTVYVGPGQAAAVDLRSFWTADEIRARRERLP
jgi:hypothetical protein